MKTRLWMISAVSLTTCLVVSTLRSAAEEEEPPPQFELALCQAVDEKGLVFLMVNGEDLNPSGFKSGQTTGWIGFPIAEQKDSSFQLEHQPLGLVDLDLEKKAGQQVLLVAYHTEISQKERGRPPRPALGVLQIHAADYPTKLKSGQRQIVAVYVGDEEAISIGFGDQKQALERLKVEVLQVDSGSGFLTLKQSGDSGEEELGILNLETKGTRILVFRGNRETGLKFQTFECNDP
jgi:hypothetical protein